MNQHDVVSRLMEYFKQNLDSAETVFEDICTSDELPKFHFPTMEVQLTAEQKREFIERYSKEVSPLVSDWKRIGRP